MAQGISHLSCSPASHSSPEAHRGLLWEAAQQVGSELSGTQGAPPASGFSRLEKQSDARAHTHTCEHARFLCRLHCLGIPWYPSSFAANRKGLL